jgi:glycosyltransferase involved in cell wall biosynthesis
VVISSNKEAHKIMIVCCTLSGAIVDFTKFWIDALSKVFDVYALTGFVYESNGQTNLSPDNNIRSMLNGNKMRSFNPACYINSVKWINEVQPDVIIFCSGAPAHNLLWDALAGYRRVAYVHDPYPHSGMRNWRLLQYRGLLRRYYREADCLIFTSDYLRRRIVSDNLAEQSRTAVVPLGLLPNHIFDFSHEAEKSIDFLFYGRMEYYKGVDVLLEADELLLDNGIDTSLTIISKGDIKKVYSAVAKIPNNVKQIKDYVPDEELINYVRSSKCVVLPYRDATATQIIQTCYFYKVPVIVTRTGALTEYAGEDIGYIVRPEDATALADAMKHVLHNEQERVERGNKGHDYLLSKFSNKSIVERMASVLENVIGGAGHD